MALSVLLICWRVTIFGSCGSGAARNVTMVPSLLSAAMLIAAGPDPIIEPDAPYAGATGVVPAAVALASSRGP